MALPDDDDAIKRIVESVALAPEDQDYVPALCEQALALQFADLHQDHLRYVAAFGQWRQWTGKVWEADTTLSAYDLVRKLCRLAARNIQDPRIEKSLGSAATVAAVERLARSDRRFAMKIDQFDADPWLVNAQSGIVDLRTGALMPHDPLRYPTKIAAAPVGGDCPKWMAFLDRVTNRDKDMQRFLQKFVGYSLTGCVYEHIFIILWGSGANGKGVFLNTIVNMLGDYAITAPMDMFLVAHGERHPTDVARLFSARLVVSQEAPKDRRWDEQKIKNLTGGDRLTGRFMRQDFFDFSPTHKHAVALNDKPSMSSVGEDMKRRVRLVPFAVEIPVEERNPRLLEELQQEFGGIMQWAIEGCLAWQAEGLKPPKAVADATREYFDEEDSKGQWLAECIEVTNRKEDWVGSTDLFNSWKHWAEIRNARVGSQTAFSKELKKKFLSQRDTLTNCVGFVGLRLRVGGVHE